MKQAITRYTINSMMEVTGDDITFIHLFYRIDNEPEMAMPIIVSYESLLDFIQQENNDAHKYLMNIRSSLHGYGPKHSKIFEIMDKEGFDLEPYIFSYFNTIEQDEFDRRTKSAKNLPSQDNEPLKAALKEIDNFVDKEFRNYNVRLDNFRDNLDQALHETTLKYFPELFEKEAKYIAAYRKNLFYTTLHFMEKIDKIMHDKL
jgi:hypothetical protein